MHASQLRPNASIGPYRIERLLAKGGMGQLYVAQRDGRRIVLKLLREQMAEDDEFRAMFLHEARLGALLDHPSIARIVDSGELDDAPYIAVEYIDGPPLNELMSRLGAIGKAEAIAIVAQVADGLAHAHGATDRDGRPLHIVHRDVSPQNVLVQRDGCVKLIDFGVARSTTQEHRTSTGVLKGKLAYMAPEQFRGENTNRSDIWSLGVVLWELLAGRRLFRRRTEAEVFSAVLIEPIPPLDLGGVLDDVLQPIVERALERDPRRRYADAARLARDLRSAARELALGCGPAELAALVRSFDELAAPRDGDATIVLSDWTEVSAEIDLTAPDLTTAATPSAMQQRHVPIARPTHAAADLAAPPARRRSVMVGALAAVALLVAGATAFWAGGAADDVAPIRSQDDRAASPAAAPSPPTSVADEPAADDDLDEPSAPPSVEPVAAAPEEPHAAEDVEEATAPRRQAARRRPRPRSAAAPAPAGTGLLYLDSDPWTTVRVGRRSLGQTPIVGAELPAGRHTVRLTDGRGSAHDVRVNIRPNAPTKRFVRLR